MTIATGSAKGGGKGRGGPEGDDRLGGKGSLRGVRGRRGCGLLVRKGVWVNGGDGGVEVGVVCWSEVDGWFASG